MGIVRDAGKKAAQGSAVGGEGKKKKATTKTPSVAERAKQLKKDQHDTAFRTVSRAMDTAKGNAGLYSVGTIVDHCRLLTGDEIQSFLESIPNMPASGSKDVMALRLAEYLNQGCPDMAAPVKKGGKPKKEKIDPEAVACQLAEFLSQADPASMTADELRKACQFVLECFTAMPAGKKDDGLDYSIRALMLAEGLAVSGTKAILAERLCIHYGFAVKQEKPKAAVAWERIDNADDAELQMLEARIHARRAALAGAGRMVDAQGNLLA